MHQNSDIDVGAERVCQLVESLPICVPWDLTAFVNTIARDRGKPIRLIADAGLADQGRLCGMWIGRDDDDIIVYDDTTSNYHCEQIILHECGHLLLDHGGAIEAGTVPRELRRLMPDIDQASIRRVLGRNSYDTQEESEAELFASLVMSQARVAYDTKFYTTFFRDLS
jgi:hypothetical protein